MIPLVFVVWQQEYFVVEAEFCGEEVLGCQDGFSLGTAGTVYEFVLF